ncbi:MAG TPA: EAL domain-containing protein, partial [Burkholderiales bacterium]
TLGEEYAIRALKNGATDYVLKTNLVRLPATVERALEEAKERRERQRLRAALEEREAALSRAQTMAKLAHVVTAREGTLEQWSETLGHLLGVPAAQVPRTTRDWLALVHPEDAQAFRAMAIETDRTRVRATTKYRVRRADGTWMHVRQTTDPLDGETAAGGRRWFHTLQDVSDQVEAEQKIERLNRVYATLSGINAATARMRDRHELFNEACRIAVEAGGLRLAWIGVVDRKREVVAPVAFSGVEDGWLGAIRLSTREDSERFGMAGRAVRDRKAVVSNDLLADQRAALRAESAQRGYRSLALFPLIVDGDVLGIFGLHSAEVGFFSEEELKLLQELANDISFGLSHLEQQDKVRRLNRVYAVLSGINGLIVRAASRDELVHEACRIAVEAGDFRMAWIGMVDAAEERVKPIAWHGDVRNFFEVAPLASTETKEGGHGLAGRVVRGKKPVISNNVLIDPQRLMKKELEERGINSVAILPLIVGSEVVGILALYAADVGFFDDEEMRLLLELAGDISFGLDHIAKADQLQYLAYYDSLTGLANRALFLDRVEQKVAATRATPSKFAVVLVDIERFKAINDAFGRQAGDHLLTQVAQRFRALGGDVHRMARLGADHFAVFSPELQNEGDLARLIEERLGALFAAPFRVAEQELRISGRAGVAVYPNDGGDAETLLRNAEAALKRTKTTGERYLFFAPEMTARIHEKLSLENKLRQALERNEFVLHYQPKVELQQAQIVGVEALIRWQSPELGLVPPGRFIPLLEETGLILPVGTWALRRASMEHRAWTEAGLRPPRVAVNVSPIQLRRRDFVQVVEQAIIEGLAPTGIDLEITESLIMEDIEANTAKLDSLRGLGIHISIDDFGTGYSSLGYLAKLPVQSLKIDRSFIVAMIADANAMTLVSTIIQLAHSLKLKVVAEGVETEEQAKFLRLMRCDEMQGYLFSKPLPEAELRALLKTPGGLRPAAY